MESKQMVRYVAIGVVLLIGVVIVLNSWVDVKPGERGFVFKPFNSPSIDTNDVYMEGTYFIIPWNEMINYAAVNQSKQYAQKVMDLNGTDVTVEVSVNYNIVATQLALTHFNHRENYTIFIDDKSKVA